MNFHDLKERPDFCSELAASPVKVCHYYNLPIFMLLHEGTRILRHFQERAAVYLEYYGIPPRLQPRVSRQERPQGPFILPALHYQDVALQSLQDLRNLFPGYLPFHAKKQSRPPSFSGGPRRWVRRPCAFSPSQEGSITLF
jgi:hypothetical protein